MGTRLMTWKGSKTMPQQHTTTSAQASFLDLPWGRDLISRFSKYHVILNKNPKIVAIIVQNATKLKFSRSHIDIVAVNEKMNFLERKYQRQIAASFWNSFVSSDMFLSLSSSRYQQKSTPSLLLISLPLKRRTQLSVYMNPTPTLVPPAQPTKNIW